MEININKDIKLRKIKISDANDVFEFASDPEIVKYLRYNKHKDINDTINVIKNVFLKSNNPLSKLVIDYQGKVIGTCNIIKINGEYEIGYQLNRMYWGNGIISTCLPYLINKFFDLFPSKNLYVTASNENNKSWKIINKFNFIKSNRYSEEGFQYFYISKPT